MLETDLDKENAEVKVMFLHPQGPSRSFKYSTQQDILVVPLSNILMQRLLLAILTLSVEKKANLQLKN